VTSEGSATQSTVITTINIATGKKATKLYTRIKNSKKKFHEQTKPDDEIIRTCVNIMR